MARLDRSDLCTMKASAGESPAFDCVITYQRTNRKRSANCGLVGSGPLVVQGTEDQIAEQSHDTSFQTSERACREPLGLRESVDACLGLPHAHHSPISATNLSYCPAINRVGERLYRNGQRPCSGVSESCNRRRGCKASLVLP